MFKELEMEPAPDKHFLRPDKAKKPKAEGYSDIHPVHKAYSAKEFATSENPLQILQAASSVHIFFDILEYEILNIFLYR